MLLLLLLPLLSLLIVLIMLWISLPPWGVCEITSPQTHICKVQGQIKD